MKKIISLLLCFVLLLSINVCAFADEVEEEILVVETRIFSPDQFLLFAEHCIIDSYSKNRIVYLENNISLSGTEFESIPIFCGVFDGKGHTISGLDISSDGSVQGLFRYITEDAVVKNLDVLGNITPGGSHSQIGGIAGNNAGSIINCSFSGSVSGSSYVGGLVGRNTVSALIEDCSVSGLINGDHFVGGIAGDNSGVIRNCSNVALINVSARENSVEISDITLDTMTSSESANTVTDIGGIAGFSNGVIRNCENYGDTGYPRMGYNVGGIAGTQSGYITDCVNYADIQGRKEVGGIAGQMEPVSLIEYAEDTLQILEGQLNTMSGLVNQASYNAQQNAGEINGEIDILSDQAGTAIDAIDTLLYGDPNDTDGMLAAENALSSAMGAMPETFSNIAYAAENTISGLSSDLMAVSNQINAMSDTINKASENLGGSISDVSDQDSADNYSGKVEACANEGDILADYNAGGITGAISLANDLDILEDWQQVGQESLNFDTQLRAVILNCENKALISGSKQNIGGIVGLQTLGLVKGSINTGSIEAENAENVGGISGQSQGYIRSNYADCRIRGNSSVGGIAGSATIVTDCRSMVDIQGASEKFGAILGLSEESQKEIENPIAENLYTSPGKDLGGIDGISYEGLAQALSKDEFLAIPDLPGVFQVVSLSFEFEDGTTKRVSLDTGKELKVSMIPAVPEKSGYIGSWDGLEEADTSAMFFDASFKAVYKAKASVIESTNKNGYGLPIMLAQGDFKDNAELSLYDCEFNLPLSYGQELVFSKRFELDGIKTIRCIIPDGLESFKVYLGNESGQWREVQHRSDLSYLVADTIDGDDRIAIVKTLDLSFIWLIAAAVVLLVSVTIIAVKLLKKRNKVLN